MTRSETKPTISLEYRHDIYLLFACYTGCGSILTAFGIPTQPALTELGAWPRAGYRGGDRSSQGPHETGAVSCAGCRGRRGVPGARALYRGGDRSSRGLTEPRPCSAQSAGFVKPSLLIAPIAPLPVPRRARDLWMRPLVAFAKSQPKEQQI